jgi:hypothetical protein
MSSYNLDFAGARPLCYTFGTAAVPRCLRGKNMNLNIYLQLIPRPKMCGTIPLLSPYISKGRCLGTRKAPSNQAYLTHYCSVLRKIICRLSNINKTAWHNVRISFVYDKKGVRNPHPKQSINSSINYQRCELLKD